MLYAFTNTCMKIYPYRIEIGLCKFVNNFIRYQVIIYNLLTI